MFCLLAQSALLGARPVPAVSPPLKKKSVQVTKEPAWAHKSVGAQPHQSRLTNPETSRSWKHFQSLAQFHACIPSPVHL